MNCSRSTRVMTARGPLCDPGAALPLAEMDVAGRNHIVARPYLRVGPWTGGDVLLEEPAGRQRRLASSRPKKPTAVGGRPASKFVLKRKAIASVAAPPPKKMTTFVPRRSSALVVAPPPPPSSLALPVPRDLIVLEDLDTEAQAAKEVGTSSPSARLDPPEGKPRDLEVAAGGVPLPELDGRPILDFLKFEKRWIGPDDEFRTYIEYAATWLRCHRNHDIAMFKKLCAQDKQIELLKGVNADLTAQLEAVMKRAEEAEARAKAIKEVKALKAANVGLSRDLEAARLRDEGAVAQAKAAEESRLQLGHELEEKVAEDEGLVKVAESHDFATRDACLLLDDVMADFGFDTRRNHAWTSSLSFPKVVDEYRKIKGDFRTFVKAEAVSNAKGMATTAISYALLLAKAAAPELPDDLFETELEEFEPSSSRPEDTRIDNWREATERFM